MSAPELVARYCPECAQRVKAPAEKFIEPQVCPKCKQRVLFLEHPAKFPSVNDDSVIQEAEKLAKFDHRASLVFICGVGIALFLLAIGVFTGPPFLVLAAAGLMFICGLAGVAMFLDHRAKFDRYREAYEQCTTALRDAAAKNRHLASRYWTFQQNYHHIIDDATQEAHDLRDAAQAAREEALEYREQMRQSVGKIVLKYLEDTKKNLKSRLTVNNYGASQDRLLKAIAFLEKQGCTVDKISIDQFTAELREDYEGLVRQQALREEQAKIRERIRDEEKARIEFEREQKRAEAERAVIEAAIAEALLKTKDEHSAEVEELRARLAEAEERSQRALSMAQQTKAGNVYVISNIGSFGENVFKIGMTRRLDPLDRVKELGDASVPFPFDVHMMISSEDAPALEAAIHREFNHHRVNRVNVRKEFFRVDLQDVVRVVEERCGKVEYIAEPDALEYRESMLISDDDVDLVFSNATAERLDDDDN